MFKITLGFDDARVHDLTIQYFDTLPVATSLHITKHGLLLATSEVGDQCGFSFSLTRSCVYQFFSLGDGDVAEASFSTLLGADGSMQIPLFSPRELTNIKPIHFLPSLAPLIKLHAPHQTPRRLSNSTPSIKLHAPHQTPRPSSNSTPLIKLHVPHQTPRRSSTSTRSVAVAAVRS